MAEILQSMGASAEHCSQVKGSVSLAHLFIFGREACTWHLEFLQHCKSLFILAVRRIQSALQHVSAGRCLPLCTNHLFFFFLCICQCHLFGTILCCCLWASVDGRGVKCHPSLQEQWFIPYHTLPNQSIRLQRLDADVHAFGALNGAHAASRCTRRLVGVLKEFTFPQGLLHFKTWCQGK